MVNQEEKWIGNSEQLVHAGYSYWTLGYALSQSGAKKLLGSYFLLTPHTLFRFFNHGTNYDRCTPARESDSGR